ncbi:Putative binding domain-containing protein, N-terminal [Xylanibacter ruminicola]|uniref:Putative binding domain-containing protein, N-terminal n=1 Tax=Xylanibacter ruminicola TaxID=839 RepID=A0A1H4F0J8_XYLRU|nr:BACON domain-containing protein [Xylanibacter ruminicola]SEA90709.1 Putative binding domain-containing protein, N-terminal [Xylanibacter ruminicola]
MKKNYLFKLHVALAICLMSQVSCMKEPSNGGLKSEVEVSGSVNYFQNSMDFDFDGGSKTMSFKSNLKWNMDISNTQNGVQWLTIEPRQGNSGSNKVTFTANENTTYEDRNVVVRFLAGDTVRNIRVNQKRLEAITLTTDKFEVPVTGQKLDIEVNHSMDFDYTIPENYKGWIHKATSATRGLLEKSIVTFTIDPSEEYEKREGKIYFTAGKEQEVVTIYQAGEGRIVLTQNEYNLTADEQEFTVDISSNFDFSVTMPDVEWLKENTSQTRGMSSHTLKFKVTKNDDYKARSAKIKISDKNSSKYEEIVIKQESTGAIITLDKSEYTVNCEKQDLDIEVKSNFDYTIDFQGANWIKQRKNTTRGITSRLLKLTIDENKNNEARTAKIKLYDKNGTASEEITITQGAKSGIEVPTKEFTVDELGGTITIKVNANAEYKLTSNNDWITIAANTRALTPHEHQVTIAALGDAEDRDGTITVSNEELNYSATITIKQRNTFYFENKSIDILVGKEKAFTVKNTTKQSVEWSSNNTAIATVGANGFVKGIKKGTATIMAKTADGKHTATCKANVCEITDMISIKSGGTPTKEGDLVKSGSQIKWAIKNNSPVKVTLKSMQLQGNASGEIGNEVYINEDLAAGSSVYKNTTIESSGGFHLPITCHFVFVYENNEYPIDAKYE